MNGAPGDPVKVRVKMSSRRNLMTSGSELTIGADGIFVTCFQGQRRLWEVHPNDITSIGAYSENEQIPEVIVAVIHGYDVVEGTSGLKELNERLTRELKTEIRVDSTHVTTPLGVVLWRPHLAGNALWEFLTIGKDGLGIDVSPDTPKTVEQDVRFSLDWVWKEWLEDDGFTFGK